MTVITLTARAHVRRPAVFSGGGGLRWQATSATVGRVPRGGPVRHGPAGRRVTRSRGQQAGVWSELCLARSASP